MELLFVGPDVEHGREAQCHARGRTSKLQPGQVSKV